MYINKNKVQLKFQAVLPDTFVGFLLMTFCS